MPGNPTEIAQSSSPMSIPSSSASVAETPRSSPSISRRSISRRCAGVYPARYGASRAAVALSTRSEVKRWISSAALRLFAKQIVRSPRDDETGHEERRLRERARPDAELRVEQRRVPEHDVALGGADVSTSTTVAGLAGERERELAGVRDRGGREQELRLGAVRARQAPQTSEHVADVRAEDAAVDVRLVDDHVAQVVEHVSPAVVVREDRRGGACRGS